MPKINRAHLRQYADLLDRSDVFRKIRNEIVRDIKKHELGEDPVLLTFCSRNVFEVLEPASFHRCHREILTAWDNRMLDTQIWLLAQEISLHEPMVHIRIDTHGNASFSHRARSFRIGIYNADPISFGVF